jgi:glycolate dehydrogenase FAD-binding subunit
LTRRPKGIGPVPFDSSLREAVKDRLTVHPDDCAAFAIAGRVPTVVASPKTFEQTADALRACALEGARVVIRGRGTKSVQPPAPAALDVVVDVSSVAKSIDIRADDLTAVVSGSVGIADLRAALAAKERFFPCDVPFAADATVGGALAAGSNGALAARFGGLRDNVLGMRVALSDGSRAFAGSHVVKSVAGFDSHKLFIGSRGTLGFIGEAVLKLAPIPPDERVLVARFADARSACSAALDVAAAPVFPYAVTLHCARSAERIAALTALTRPDEWLAVYRFGGLRRSVARAIEAVRQTCSDRACSATDVLDRGGVERAWLDVAELAGGRTYPAAEWCAYRAACLPTEVPTVLEAAAVAWPTLEISAHPTLGVVFAHVRADAASDAPALWRAVSDAAGSAICTSAPPGRTDIAMPPRSYAPYALFRRLKTSFDASGTLDPGRMLGAI